MTKEELKEELKEVKNLYFVGNDDWNRFTVYYVKNGKLVKLWINADEKDTPTYWVPMHRTKSDNWIGGFFRCNTIGTDRIFEIAYHVGLWLYNDGYRFQAVAL